MSRSRLLLAGLFSLACFSLASQPSLAADPASLLDGYRQQAQSADPAFKGFSAERGKAIYFDQQVQDGQTISCSSCHTSDPTARGKTPAFRAIEPLAPSANPKRFTDSAKVEKWFKRNCNDVYARECTAQEKGDFISWIKTL